MTAAATLPNIELNDGWYQILVEDDQLEPVLKTQDQKDIHSRPPQRLLCHNSKTLRQDLVAGKSSVVDASLVYSRGNLAITPCSDCMDQYKSCGSALPFPECVILPERWGFACANCIVSGNSEKCAFYVANINGQNGWKRHEVEVDQMGSKDLDWFRRGHPLSTNTSKRQTIWIFESAPDTLAHNWKDPGQTPAFVHPSEVPSAKVPSRFLERAQKRSFIDKSAQPTVSANCGKAQFRAPVQSNTVAPRSRPQRTIHRTWKVGKERNAWDRLLAAAKTGRQGPQKKRRARQAKLGLSGL